ncbi:chemotaxis protein CheV, partial [Listeria monocytogenes]|nr:chemotaxis protein CheV [Listeria monocytogenes]
FSSLITEDLEHKGAGVGADAQVSKPNIHQLINILDELVL